MNNYFEVIFSFRGDNVVGKNAKMAKAASTWHMKRPRIVKISTGATAKEGPVVWVTLIPGRRQYRNTGKGA